MKPKEWDKIAKNYFEELSSPFSKGMNSKLAKAIGKGSSVIDLGTGIGNLLNFLSQNFKQVLAVDFSEEMLKIAKKNNKAKNIIFKKEDITNVKVNKEFDVTVAINSILMPSIIKSEKAMKEAYRLTKKGGKFVGVFPSLNSDIYRASLTFDREYEETKDEEQAIKNTKIIMAHKNYDFLSGFYDNDGKQKHWFKVDLLYRLKKVGFKNIKIEKLHYAWEDSPESFEGEEELWDWMVVAEK